MNDTCLQIGCEETLVLYLTAVVVIHCILSWVVLCCCFHAWDANKLWLFGQA